MNSSLSRDEKRYLFEDLFADAIESWFTADIACCDACFDEFVREWPALYLRDIGFQSSVWDLGLIYEGSRLREMYSKEEFWEFVKDIECPRCLSPLKCHIWPYNLPFDPPDGFETAAQQIATIAGVTPFLLLTHPFALRVHQAIQDLGAATQPEVLGQPYYRGRILKASPTVPVTDFDKPPPSCTREGRYNHAGLPALYLASDLLTCFLELREPATDFFAVRVVIPGSLKILDLMKIEEGVTEHAILSAVLYSSLLSRPRAGDDFKRPQYVFTRFVADCARAAGFDGIRYPSTRISKAHNLVLLAPVKPLADLGHLEEVVSFDGNTVTVLRADG